MTRRRFVGLPLIFGLPALSLRSGAQTDRAADNRPDSFRVYSDSPRLFLRPARLKLLRRERERQSLRWEQFDALWTANVPWPEPGWTAALRYQIAQEEPAGKRAIQWAAGPSANGLLAKDLRQIALVADWCAPLMSAADLSRIHAKLTRALNGPAPKTLADARSVTMAAAVVSEAQPDLAEKALTGVFDGFWMKSFLPALREGRILVSNADACPLMELLHVMRDNINFDLRETFPTWFRDYPMIHLMAHYPAPFPASENEYRIPADREIRKSGPDLAKAVLSRAAELSMVAFDTNSPSTQLLQGFLMNDRFVMRGTVGIPYELMWANPYQPGLSYYHVPLAQHDDVGGQLFVRSTWEDDASWIGFFEGRLQLFADGGVAEVDPKLAHEAMDIEEATVFFGRDANKFHVPQRKADEATDDVFIVGLEARRAYHVEVDGEEMVEEVADPGGIIYLPGLPAGVGVRLSPRPPSS
jgi:hypothetical protein